MQYFPLMQRLETPDNLYKDIPDFLLLNVSFSFLVVTNLLEDISVVSIFHDKTKTGVIYITVTYHRELEESSIKASL